MRKLALIINLVLILSHCCFGDTFTSHLKPNATVALDIGTTSLLWRFIYSQSFTDGTASWTNNSLSGFTSIEGTTLTDGVFTVSGGVISVGTWQGDTVTVPHGGTGTTSLTDGGLLVGSGTGAITALSVASNGQIPIGDGAADPVLATLTEGLAIDVTNGAGSITIAFDPTELTGSRTWGDASTDTIVWTWNRNTGTDPTMTMGDDAVTFNGDLFADRFLTGVTTFRSGGIVDASFSNMNFNAVTGLITIQTIMSGADIALESADDILMTATTDMAMVVAADGLWSVSQAGNTRINMGATGDIEFSSNIIAISGTTGLRVTNEIVVGGTLSIKPGVIEDSGGTVDFVGNIITTTGQGRFSSLLLTGINQATVNTNAVDFFTATGGIGGAAQGVSAIAGSGSDRISNSGDGGVADNLDGTGGRGGNDFDALGAGGANTNNFGFAAGKGGSYSKSPGPGGNATGTDSGDGGDGGDFKIDLPLGGTSVAGSAGVPGVFEVGDDSGNVTRIARGGTLEFIGDATVFRDINIGAGTLSGPIGLRPGLANFIDENGADTDIATFGIAVGEGLSGLFEMQHDYKEGSDIVFHVHWQGIAAPTGTDKVQWQLTYTIGDSEATLDAVTVITVETDFDTQYKFKRSDFSAITGTNINIEDQFIFTLQRIAASGDEYSGEALLATVGIHYEVDTIGSRQILVK